MLLFIIERRSKRSCRLSIVKPEPSTVKLEPSIIKQEIEPITDENTIEEEDPVDLYQLGDIFWVRVTGNPWWPALIYGI